MRSSRTPDGSAERTPAVGGSNRRGGARLACRGVADVLLATDADWIHDEVAAALDGEHTVHAGARAGRRRARSAVLMAGRAASSAWSMLDLQIGNMGGMAACMDLRLEHGAGRLPDVAVLMLLDREADIFLARRSDADGWLVKPLDAFRLRRRPPPCWPAATTTKAPRSSRRPAEPRWVPAGDPPEVAGTVLSPHRVVAQFG